ncbi:MAG TPA: DUF1329 domain-containing protein [Candidatus Binatus sp.]|nr:DUF1329 domain-containing protein [Candidatus Binatus sp.]
MKLSRFATTVALALAISAISSAIPAAAQVQPGDVITPANASKVENLVSPGNFALVQQGMMMKITPTAHLDWPPSYKAATEQYSPQVSLTPDGNLKNYVAGLPFPLVDANDPQAATKIMWNFEFRPLFTDDIDTHNIEAISHRAGSSNEIEHFTFGHFGTYKYIGRTEVAPMPVDPDVLKTGIASRSGAFPILEPQEMAGAGIVTQRSVLPGVEDAVWEYSRETRRLRRLPMAELSDAFGVASDGPAGASAGGVGGATTYASTWDPDSAYGFSGRVQDYNYKLLGEQPMLASVDGSSPATPCTLDGGRSVCPENWQVRRVYVIEATAKPRSVGGNVIVPRRVFYIDAEGWFITASDLYDHNGRMWKTIANFHAYSDRATPNSNVAIWPFKRIFQTAMVEEDVTDGFSTVVYTPGLDSHNGVYVNMGAVDRDFFTPAQLVQSSR